MHGRSAQCMHAVLNCGVIAPTSMWLQHPSPPSSATLPLAARVAAATAAAANAACAALQIWAQHGRLSAVRQGYGTCSVLRWGYLVYGGPELETERCGRDLVEPCELLVNGVDDHLVVALAAEILRRHIPAE